MSCATQEMVVSEKWDQGEGGSELGRIRRLGKLQS